MKLIEIDVVQTFPNAKGAIEDVICCANLDLVVVISASYKDLHAYSISTGKRIFAHKFPRYNLIEEHYHEGRWMFLRVYRANADCRQTVVFDLQELIIYDWIDTLPERARARFRGCCRDFAFFQDTSLPSSWFAFRLSDGQIVDPPSSVLRLMPMVWPYGEYFGAYTSSPDKVPTFQIYQPDSHGMLTSEVVGEFICSGIIKARWDQRWLVKSAGEPTNASVNSLESLGGMAPDLQCLNFGGNVCYELHFPEPSLEEFGGRRPSSSASVVFVRCGVGNRLVAYRHWSLQSEGSMAKAFLQWAAFDRDSGEIMWTREFFAEGSLRLYWPFVVGDCVLAFDPDGIDVTDVGTGVTSRLPLPNAGCYAGNGYYLSERRESYFGLSEPTSHMPYFFWKEFGKPLVMSRLIKE